MDFTAAYTRQRITGRANFVPTGQAYGADLGDIVMMAVKYGIKRKEAWSARRGILSIIRNDAYASMLEWEITVDEFAGPTLPYFWGGTLNSNVTQSAGTAATTTFTSASKKGGTFDIVKYGLNNASLTAPASKVEGYTADYVIDRATGILYIPLSSTISDGTTLTVTYDCPAITFDSVTALQVLNRPGTIKIYGEDDSGSNKGPGADAIPPVRFVATLACILSSEDGGDFKPDNFRNAKMRAIATAAMTFNQLQ